MEVKYQYEIQAMMYTSGDVRSPLPESTQLMEDIVKNQVIELVSMFVCLCVCDLCMRFM